MALCRAFGRAAGAAVLVLALPAHASAAPAWTGRLQAELARIDAQSRADIGVYVRDLDSGASVSFRADETWYLASTVKVPVAIAVLRGVERGDFTLDTPLTLRAADLVDGAGQTNHHPVGTPLSLRFLLEQMIIYSDNTASDMLIGLVGLRSVNALVQSLVPQGFQPITSLADVRRHIYGQLAPAAAKLSGKDFLLLKAQQGDAQRREMLSRLLHVPAREFRMPSVAHAYDAYYASGVNSGRLDAYGELLSQLADGKALGATQTAYLLEVMGRVKTGQQRIKAGLPAEARFAHKTGTQSARTCDSGLITLPRAGPHRRFVVVACTRGEFSVVGSDKALRQVGTALCRSGLLSGGDVHEPPCPADSRRQPAPLLPPRTPQLAPSGAAALSEAVTHPVTRMGSPGPAAERGAAERERDAGSDVE